jgi:hypothetical protein
MRQPEPDWIEYALEYAYITVYRVVTKIFKRYRLNSNYVINRASTNTNNKNAIKMFFKIKAKSDNIFLRGRHLYQFLFLNSIYNSISHGA